MKQTRHGFYVIDRTGEAVSITTVDEVVAILYLEKAMKVLIQSLPFPNGKLRPESKSFSKVIQVVRGLNSSLAFWVCAYRARLNSRLFQPDQKEKQKTSTEPGILKGKWRQVGRVTQGPTHVASPSVEFLGCPHFFLSL